MATPLVKPALDPAKRDFIVANLRSIIQKIHSSSAPNRPIPRLVVISRSRSCPEILAAYEAGQRHFAEYNVGELISKVPKLPADIKWHLVGYFKMNKAKGIVAAVPNIWAIESVDTMPKATRLNRGFQGVGRTTPVHTFVQVHTGEEQSKVGAKPWMAKEMARRIYKECRHLKFAGLMSDRVVPPHLTFAHGGPATELQMMQALLKSIKNEIPSFGLELSMAWRNLGDDLSAAFNTFGVTEVRVGKEVFGKKESSKKKPWERDGKKGNNSEEGDDGYQTNVRSWA